MSSLSIFLTKDVLMDTSTTRVYSPHCPRILVWMIFGCALMMASCFTLLGPFRTARTLVVGEVAVEATNFASNDTHATTHSYSLFRRA
jgi:hypothetical protein